MKYILALLLSFTLSLSKAQMPPLNTPYHVSVVSIITLDNKADEVDVEKDISFSLYKENKVTYVKLEDTSIITMQILKYEKKVVEDSSHILYLYICFNKHTNTINKVGFLFEDRVFVSMGISDGKSLVVFTPDQNLSTYDQSIKKSKGINN